MRLVRVMRTVGLVHQRWWSLIPSKTVHIKSKNVLRLAAGTRLDSSRPSRASVATGYTQLPFVEHLGSRLTDYGMMRRNCPSLPPTKKVPSIGWTAIA